MAHYCSDCEKLNTKNKKYPGCFECKQKKKDKAKNAFVWACDDACDKYAFDFSRKSNDRKDMYADAWKEKKKDHSKITGAQLFWYLILFFIIWLLAKCSK